MNDLTVMRHVHMYPTAVSRFVHRDFYLVSTVRYVVLPC